MASHKICLNMIVKNESAIIKRCIDSVIDIVDTWCIVDTGSTDGTQEIIKDLLKDKPGVLHEREWVNFGHNRDEALKLAKEWGDWILLTDADMMLVNQGFSKDELDITCDVYDIMQDNGTLQYNNMRLLNTRKNWSCVGVTHEYYAAEGDVQKRGFLSKVFFRDFADGGSKQDKFKRDILLLEKGLENEPENSRYMFYLAQSYRDTQNYDNAIHWYQQRVNANGWDEEQWFAQYMIAWCKKEKGESFDDVYNSAMIAWKMRPWRIESIYMLAVLAREQKKWYHAYMFSKICATTEWPKYDILFMHKHAYGVGALDEFSISSYYVGKFDESETACLRILEKGEVHPQEVPRIKRNLWYAKKALGHYSEKELLKFIEEKKLI